MVPESNSSQLGHDAIMVHSPLPLRTQSEDLEDVCNFKLMQQIVNLLETMVQRQTLQDQRIAELHRQLVGNQLATPGFPQFQSFPPEIRCHIWKMAIPRRTLRPYHRFRSHYEGYPEDWVDHWRLPPPIIAQVCRESRSVALQRGGLFYLSHRWGKYWTWFDGSRDLLDLSGRRRKRSRVRGVGSLVDQADVILLQSDNVEDKWVCRLFRQDSFRQRVRTIYLQTDDTLAVNRDIWHPHAVARLFGQDLFVMVGLEDKDQTDWLRDILGMNMEIHEGRHFGPQRQADKLVLLAESIRDPLNLEDFNDAKKSIMEAWLSHGGTQPLSEDCFDDEGSIKETKLWSDRMPHIRLVQSFERWAKHPELDVYETDREEEENGYDDEDEARGSGLPIENQMG